MAYQRARSWSSGGVLLPLLAAFAIAAPSDEGLIRDWVAKRGYPFESRAASTADGIRLGLFRLPRPGAPVVHLQHGVLDSAWAWVFNQEFKALAFELYDAGYDVWLGNNRGNGYSQRFADGADASGSEAFWDFTYDDMARLDIPAMIEAVLNATGKERLAYIGHSQGTTQMFIAGSLGAVMPPTSPEARLRLWLQDKVSVFIALSPIAWLGSSKSTLLKAISGSWSQILAGPFFRRGFLESETWRQAAKLLCTLTFGTVCKIGIDVVCGDGELDTDSNVEAYSAYFPFGTSFKDIAHFAQDLNTDHFSRYNYGTAGNEAAYGQPVPPDYPVGSMSVPTALFMGDNDKLADDADTQRLEVELAPSGKVVFNRHYAGFSHVTWTLGSGQAAFYVADVLKVLQDHHDRPHEVLLI